MTENSQLKTATLAGGCFWCLDAAFRLVLGVTKVVAGYAGGSSNSPTYEEVARGKGGHAEAVQITYEPAIISYSDILDLFWALHDPTTPNQQGADVGVQYRSLILYLDQEQKEQAEVSIASAQKLWSAKIVTELLPQEKFWPAEDYHQDYFAKNPTNAYCQIVINPKLTKLKEKYTKLLKPQFR